jgi:uncharacterized protein
VAAPYSFRGTVPMTRGEETVFFDACQQGRLLIQRCQDCGESIFYPRSVCPFCLSGDVAWVEAAGTGRVHTFTIQMSHREKSPPITAIVALDEGPRLMTRLMCAPEEAEIDMPVRVAFATIDDSGFQVPVFVLDREREPEATSP